MFREGLGVQGEGWGRCQGCFLEGGLTFSDSFWDTPEDPCLSLELDDASSLDAKYVKWLKLCEIQAWMTSNRGYERM